MVVDDAGVTEYRAFHLETWIGTEESWILPAFSPVRGLELAAGAVITEDETFAVTEAKYMFREPANNCAGLGLVAGTLIAPFGEFYTYVPVTLPLLEERVVLHCRTCLDSVAIPVNLLTRVFIQNIKPDPR